MADSFIRLTHLQKQLKEVRTAVPLLWVWHGAAAHLHMTASKMSSKSFNSPPFVPVGSPGHKL